MRQFLGVLRLFRGFMQLRASFIVLACLACAPRGWAQAVQQAPAPRAELAEDCAAHPENNVWEYRNACRYVRSPGQQAGALLSPAPADPAANGPSPSANAETNPETENPFINSDVPLLVHSAQGAAVSGARLGFRTGGAQDVENFRENVKEGFLPQPSSITFEGLVKQYFFDTSSNTTQPCTELFCPIWSLGVSPDPLVVAAAEGSPAMAAPQPSAAAPKPDVYMAVGLDSGLSAADFRRPQLNLVLLLDVSGSMGSPFNTYYYDSLTGKPQNLTETEPQEVLKEKIDVAKEVLTGILAKLAPGDRVSIVLFSDQACVPKRLGTVGCMDLATVTAQINRDVAATGSTNMGAGYVEATKQLNYCGACLAADLTTTENRIVLITGKVKTVDRDAQPNEGELTSEGFLALLRNNSDHKIYTTVVGVGLDFNTDLIDAISKVPGANYFSVHSPGEFRKRLDEDFDYFVSPLVFDLQLRVDPSSVAGPESWRVLQVYGSPNPNSSALTDSGTLVQVNTLFPSPKTEAGVKGGVVLLRLRPPADPAAPLALQASYVDRAGVRKVSRRTVPIPEEAVAALVPGNATSAAPAGAVPGTEYYQSSGVEKAVLLARYADLVRTWLLDEWQDVGNYTNPNMPQPIVIPPDLCGAYPQLFCDQTRPYEVKDIPGGCTLERWLVPGSCILPVPGPVMVPLLGRWERTSRNLTAGEPAKDAISEFLPYLEMEMAAVNDTSLEQEVDILNRVLAAPS